MGALMLLCASVYSQSDSLGMPGDNLNLRVVLSIFKQSSSVEDFEKRLNSADTKVNNLDLNGDNQVDYLRVVDYGKDEFHSIVIQDPVSKLESQDVAVIEIVKKDDNTAHIQIVGDETLYGKNYIIEPENQAPIKSSSKKNSDVTTDDVYESGNASTHVMINVWGWPSVSYIYSPGYVYWVSPWYWGYYPGWYSPWRPYGWYYYHSGFIGYNYGFYGYRRHHHAFPHVHNYYYGRRVSSSYVQKTAPRYNSRRDGAYNNANKNANRESQHRSGTGNRPVNNTPRNTSGNQVKTRDQNNRVQSGQQKQSNQNRTQKSSNPKQSQGSGGQKVNSAPRSGSGGAGRSTGGGGSRGSGGGGGSRGSGGSRGGGHR